MISISSISTRTIFISRCCQRLCPVLREQREMKIVRVEMDDIEIIGAACHAMQHHQMLGERIPALGIQPKRPLAARPQRRFGLRISAGEQGHLVSLPNELLREIRHHPLGSAIKLRWTALVERSNLRNSHLSVVPSIYRHSCEADTVRAP